MDSFYQQVLERLENHFDEQDDLCEAVEQDQDEVDVNKIKSDMSKSIRLGRATYKLNQKWKTPKYDQLKSGRWTDVEEIGAVFHYRNGEYVVESDEGNVEEGDTAVEALVNWINSYKDTDDFVKGSIQLEYDPIPADQYNDDHPDEEITLAFLTIQYKFNV